MDDRKICPRCETENESEYSYCKNCGEFLLEKEPAAPAYTAENQQTDAPVCPACHTQNERGFNFCKNCGAPLSPAAQFSVGLPDEINGVPTDDLKTFVGKNGDKIVQKWAKAEHTHRNISWCWPVALLTAFFGVAGAAIWFLYRRMYRYGILLLTAALILIGLQVALLSEPIDVLGTELLKNEEYALLLDGYANSGDYLTYQQGLNEFLENNPFVLREITKVNSILNSFSMLETALALIFGMFSLRIYKNFVFSRLRLFTRKPTTMELSLSGGTSVGAAAIGILVYIMLSGSIATLLAIGIVLNL